MDIVFNKRRAQSDDHLIPMINIVFLILIFFMIAGQIQMSFPKGIELPTGETCKPIEQERMEFYLNSSGELSINNQIINIQKLESFLNQSHEKTWVLIADKTITASHLNELLEKIQAAGITQFKLMTQGIAEAL